MPPPPQCRPGFVSPPAAGLSGRDGGDPPPQCSGAVRVGWGGDSPYCSRAARAEWGVPPLSALVGTGLCLPRYSGRSHVGPGGCPPSLLSVPVGRDLSPSAPALKPVGVSLPPPRRIPARRGGPGISPSPAVGQVVRGVRPTWRCGAGLWMPCPCRTFPSPDCAVQPQMGPPLPWGLRGSPRKTVDMPLPGHHVLSWVLGFPFSTGGPCEWGAGSGTTAWACPLGGQRNNTPSLASFCRRHLAPRIPFPQVGCQLC